MLLKIIHWSWTSLKSSGLYVFPIIFRSYAIKKPSYYRNFIKREPITMKIKSPNFRGIFTPEIKVLIDIFKKYNYELRIAGGAVRDLLMHKTPNDIDFATVATPDQMKEMFELEGIRMLNKKGEKHGTITARINDNQNFEVTTLRVDLLTDGRRAEVEFTTDWQLDANRRDLTINALFLDFDGTVYDYFHGIDDLENRRVAFVGDAVERVQEDYLRILRYFRFYGRIAVEPDKHEAATLSAIRENLDGLKNVSGERLWMEFKKILTGNHNKKIVLRMIDVGLAPFMGLPEKANTEEFEEVINRSMSLNPDPATLLASFLRTENDVCDLHKRLHLSNYERDLCYFLVKHRNKNTHSDSQIIPTFQLLMFNKATTLKITDFKQYVCELFKYKGEIELFKEFDVWQIPKFPINGTVLINAGFGLERSPKIAKVLKPLREAWVESKFTLDEQALLNLVPSILEKIN